MILNHKQNNIFAGAKSLSLVGFFEDSVLERMPARLDCARRSLQTLLIIANCTRHHERINDPGLDGASPATCVWHGFGLRRNFAVAVFIGDVLAFDVAELAQRLPKGPGASSRMPMRRIFASCCARGERPRNGDVVSAPAATALVLTCLASSTRCWTSRRSRPASSNSTPSL
jgi:hypothetical protein